MGIIFYPRGGSAQVVRYLSRALIGLGHRVHLLTGTLKDSDPEHDARIFYQDIPLSLVDYTPAYETFNRGENPISETLEVPFHPSYEDKPGVPDRVFYKVKPSEYDGLLKCWKKALTEVTDLFQPDILHLHHLNHMHLAAAEIMPSVPKATQIHGTELFMLENMTAIEKKSGSADTLFTLWRNILMQASMIMDHHFAISPDVLKRSIKQFSIQESDISIIPNGVDLSIFKPANWPDQQKLDFLRKILVQDPKGWDESCVPGSVSYKDADISKFIAPSGKMKPLVLFVGRFLKMKRIPLLIRAVAKSNQILNEQKNKPLFNLLIWGGMPGEWEGEHPYTLTKELGFTNIFFTGWLPHSILSQGLNIADIFVAPSFFEPFGQVYLEAMAAKVPVIATRSGGPLSFVKNRGPESNGWLCDVDSVDSLATVLSEAVMKPEECKRRGENALRLVHEKYDWVEIAEKFVKTYQKLISRNQKQTQ
jgi:glycosyltransferase involved in cell wall biosynthesis